MGIGTSIKSWWESMTPAEKINSVFRGITTLIVGGGTVVCVHEVRKSKNMIDFAVKDASELVNIEVSDALIEEAVKNAANCQIRKSVQAAADEASRQIRDETSAQVEEAVRDARRQISDSVSNKLEEECRKINEHEIMKEIRDKAADKLADKLDKNLDTITDEYSKNLSNMGRVYEALADKLQSKA